MTSFLKKLLVGLPVAALAVILISWLTRYGVSGFIDSAPEVVGTSTKVAALLLNRYLLAFEAISIILLVAIIGAMALGRKEEDLPWQ